MIRLLQTGILFVAALAPPAARAAEVAAQGAQAGAEKLRSFGLAGSGAESPPYGRVLLVLVLMIGAAWGITWLLRRYGFKLPFLPGAASAASREQAPIRVVARSVLPGGISCQVIETQGRQVLITVTRQGVTSLVLGDVEAPKAPT